MCHGSAWVRSAQRWVELAEAHLTALGAPDRACWQLGKRVLGDETTLLSPDAAADLGAELSAAGDLVTLYNAAVWDLLPTRLKQPDVRAKTLADMGPGLAAAVEERVTYLKDRAKAEVLRLMGEDNTAAELMGRWVF